MNEKEKIAKLEKRVIELEKFLEDISCDGCKYGDNCPPFAGTRHGTCIPCRCRKLLEKK